MEAEKVTKKKKKQTVFFLEGRGGIFFKLIQKHCKIFSKLLVFFNVHKIMENRQIKLNFPQMIYAYFS